LLDQLFQKRLEIGEFIEEWYRNEASPALRHAENVVQLPQPAAGAEAGAPAPSRRPVRRTTS
jgi:hypothetical protein